MHPVIYNIKILMFSSFRNHYHQLLESLPGGDEASAVAKDKITALLKFICA